MSAGTLVAPLNWVYDTLRAAAEAAPLADVTTENVLLAPEGDNPMQNRCPGIIIRPAAEEWNVESWRALMRTHGGEYAILVDCYCHSTLDTTANRSVYPYGKVGGAGACRGAFTLLEDVLNVIEGATDGFRAGGTALSIRIGWRPPRREGANLYIASAAIIPTLQYAAGAR